MAKKRTYNKKQTGKKTAAKRNTKNQATRLDLAIVVLFVLSILSAVLIYGKSGVIGIKLTEILGGLIGIIRYPQIVLKYDTKVELDLRNK